MLCLIWHGAWQWSTHSENINNLHVMFESLLACGAHKCINWLFPVFPFLYLTCDYAMFWPSHPPITHNLYFNIIILTCTCSCEVHGSVVCLVCGWIIFLCSLSHSSCLHIHCKCISISVKVAMTSRLSKPSLLPAFIYSTSIERKEQ